jgi:copper(I)-binding protein
MKIDADRTVDGGSRRMALRCGLVLLLLAPNAGALLIVNQPWARPAARGQVSEAYMNLTSTDGAMLVAVRSGDAAAVVIRGPGKGGPTARLLRLPAGTPVALAPGKDRLALSGLSRSVKLGERLALTLTFEGADGTRQDIPVAAEVRMRSPVDDERSVAHASHKH